MTDGTQRTAVEQQLATAAQAVHELKAASGRVAELTARHQQLSDQLTAAQSLAKDDQHQSSAWTG
jgi:hypothetical protein